MRALHIQNHAVSYSASSLRDSHIQGIPHLPAGQTGSAFRIPHLSLILCLALLAGCANYTEPIVVPTAPTTAAQRNFDIVWDGALATLRDYRFTIDQQNRRDGQITTLPVTGQQWFEFWRKDAATRCDLAEGSLQTIYRTVRVTIEPVKDRPWMFAARVEAFTSRSNRQIHQMTDVVQAYNLFAIPGRGMARERMLIEQSVEDIPTAAVTPLGRDNDLEAKIAASIAKRVDECGQQSVAGAPTGSTGPTGRP